LERKKVRKYVLDASVAVKWFVDEEASDRARLLRNGFLAGKSEIAAPDLLKYEVATALRWHPVAHIDSASLARALVALDDYQFLISPSRDAWGKAIELSYSAAISPYDGIYLALAQVLRSPLVTADKELIAVIPVAERRNVMPLVDMELP